MVDNYNNTGPSREIDLGGMNRKPIPALYGDLPVSNVARNCLEALSLEAGGFPATRWVPSSELKTFDPNNPPNTHKNG